IEAFGRSDWPEVVSGVRFFEKRVSFSGREPPVWAGWSARRSVARRRRIRPYSGERFVFQKGRVRVRGRFVAP
uniref:Uncharacterized protein n=1 Tax=Leersia perrieri TaxID=77586 RepID=A0A0D9WI00_9ORYZ